MVAAATREARRCVTLSAPREDHNADATGTARLYRIAGKGAGATDNIQLIQDQINTTDNHIE